MANETTITTKLRVTGLDQLEKANSLMNKLKSAGNFKVTGSDAFGKMASQMDKAAAGAERLRKAMGGIKEAGSAGNGIARIASEMNKATQASEKLESSMRQAMDYSKQMGSAGEKLASSQTKAAASAEKFESAQRQSMMNMNKRTQTYKQQGESIRQSTSGWVKSAAQAEKTATSAGKIKMALGDAFAMFSVGQLGMTAVMAGVEGVKSAFTGGYETIKERQQGQAMWATSIEDAHPKITGKQLTKQSNAANRMIMSTAIKAGNDYSEANAMAKQVYSSSAGKYSGNVKLTNRLVKGMFNIQDANALNENEMLRMRTAVGNIGDTGKMNGNIAKSLNLLDGKMTRAIRKEYKRRTGHELAKTKSGNYDWSKVDAETAYAGLDKYGNSGGIGQASARYNRTLGGMTRAGKAAINNGMADFETELAKRINKSFGGKGGIISKLSGFFTDQDKVTGVAKSAARSLTSLAVGIGKVGQVGMGAAKSMKPFATGFVKGFASEYKSITNGIKSAYDTIKGIGKSIEGALPKGTGGKLKEMLSGLGSATGKVTAFLLALRGFSKIPVLGKGVSKIVNPVAKLLGKIPGVGKVLSGFVRTLTGVKPEREMSAAGKMMTASDQMLEAAGRMNGSNNYPGEGGSGDYGSSGKRPTRAKYRSRSAKKGWGRRLVERGESLLGAPGSRTARKAGGFTKFKSGALVKAGGLLEKLGGSKIVGGITKLGGAAKGLGRVFSRSGGGLTALFGAFDIADAMSSTKAGTKTRHKAVGSATGSTVGGVAGGMLGSLLDPFIGPLGTIGGGMIGSWLGGKAGKAIGGLNFGKIGKSVGGFMKNFDNKHLMADVKGMGSSVGGFMKNINPFKGMKISNPFKDFKMPKFKMPSLKGLNIKNPFKGWKMPKIKLPKIKLPKVKNPFKGWKIPKLKMPSMPKWLKSITGWGKGADKADKSTKKASNSTKKASKNVSDVGKKGKSSFNTLSKSAGKAWKSITKGAKNIGKSGKSAFKGFSKSIKSGLKTAKSAAKSGTKGISTAIKSGIKNVSKAGKSSFKTLTKSVKSGLKSAKSAAKSGAKGIGTAVKSGLKNVGKSAKSAFKSLPNSIKSGMSKAKSAARSGARGIVSAVKSGMSKMGSAGKAGASKLASSVKSGMDKAKSAARSGANQIVSAVKSGMSKMSSAGQAGTSKLASSVRSGMNQVASAAKSGVNKAASSVKSGFNKMASAAQSASSRAASSMSKIGSAASSAAGKVRSLASAINSLHSKTITIKANVTGNGASKLATGTPGAKMAFHHLATGTPGPGSHLAGGWASNGGVKTGMYVVNDAPGSNFQEAFKMKNGLIGLFPKKRNLHVPLLNGMQVLNGEDTHKMFPHLAKGTPGARSSMVPASGGKEPVINITVNVSVDGSSTTGDFTKMANQVANAIGEKFKVIMPRLEV